MVLVIVVNWNGAAHTCTCLESLASQAARGFDVVVCDNASGDGSVDAILLHAAQRWSLQPHAPLGDAGGPAPTSLQAVGHRADSPRPSWERLWIWRLADNLGYAGGANVALQWGMRAGYEAFWILNNDLRLAPDALQEVRRVAAASPCLGPIGSVLMHWDASDRVQAVAGRYHRALGVGVHLKDEPTTLADGFRTVDYPVGACLYATRELVEQVGPMDPGYFLYYEEVDWSERARRAGYRPVVALRSRAQHREGASTGSPEGVRHKSALSEYFGAVNRLRITARFWPWLWPVVWASLGLVVLERLIHAEWRRAGIVLQVMLGRRGVPVGSPGPSAKPR